MTSVSLTRNSALNVAGSVLPLVVAFPAMAIMARTLGVERFGLVLLAWALVGYAGVLDLGLTRAVVRAVAAPDATRDDHRRVMSTAVATVLALGGLGALMLVLFGQGVPLRMGVNAALAKDVSHGVLLVAAALLMLLPSLVLQGYWDGVEDFVEANKQRALSGSAVPGLSALAVIIEPTFTAAMAGLAVARALGLGLALRRGRLYNLLGRDAVRTGTLRDLLSFGGGIAISNVVSPLMGYLDRYVLAFAQGPTAVGPYAAAAEVAIKLLVLPVAVTRSLFPRLVGRTADSDAAYGQAARLIAGLCLPVAALLAAAASPIMTLWLGAEFVANGAGQALQVLMLGYLLSAFAQLPYTRLHGAGHSNVTAAIHLVEVLPFLGMCYALSAAFGVVGAAWAWTLRNGVDLMLMLAADHWKRRTA